MQYILDFCYDTFVRKKEHIKKQSPAQSPPSSPRQPQIYNCCNCLCFNTTKKLIEWKHVKTGTKRYFFCSHECWDDWLKTPNQIGSWSPVVLTLEQIDEIETLYLDSPRNQGTTPNGGCDIDLLPPNVFEDI